MEVMAGLGLMAGAVGAAGLAGLGYYLLQMSHITQELILRKFRRPGLRRVA